MRASPTRVTGRRRESQAGTSLVEVMVASAILLSGIVSLAGIFTLGISVNKIQGEVGSRTVTYAQSKMEELLGLDYTDVATDLRVSPPAAAGGTGLLAGGSVDPAAPDPARVDYLDASGARVAAASAAFTRQWRVVDDPGGHTKTIAVFVRARPVMGLNERPTTTLVTIKADK